MNSAPHSYKHEAASGGGENDEEKNTAATYRRLKKLDVDLGNIDTPYGTLIKTWEVAKTAAEDTYHKIAYLCPMALLYHLCSMSYSFACKLQAACQSVGRIVIYMDDVTPGNIRRPDAGRCYMAVYWSLLDFPAHCLSSDDGWFPLTYIPKKVYQECRGGVSHLCERFLRAFFPSTGHSSASLFLTAASSTWSFVISLKFSCWLTDGDAFPRIADSKSTSGTKPCPKCKNCLARCSPEDIPEGSQMVHVSCGDPSKFIEWTPAEVLEAQRHLAAQSAAVAAGVIRATQLTEDEQCLGYKHSPDGLLAGDMAEVADVPRSLYMDWMHSLVSSGGVGQYELNQFLRRILGLVARSNRSAMFAKLDDFRKAIQFPAREPKLRGLKLEDRVVDKDTAHVRMFAGECMQLIFVIALYSTMQLVPEGHLQAEVECFLLLTRILAILRSGPKAVARLDLLRRLVWHHHGQFLRLYPQCAHIKPHLLWHILDSMELFKVNLSCFTPERIHKHSKQIGMFAFKQWCLTMLRRHLHRLCDRVARDDFLAEYRFESLQPLQGPRNFTEAVSCRDLELQLHNLSKQCKSVHTPIGMIAPSDVAMFRGSGGEKEVGVIKKVLKNELDGSPWCLVSLCPFVADNCYRFSLPMQMLLIPAKAVINVVPYYSEEDRLYIVATADSLV
jgi:hypothetical protein